MKPAPRKPGNARQRFRRLLHGTLVALLPFAALSCGDGEDRKPVYPVQGQLVVDGKPARGAYVLFHPVNDADPQATRPHGQVSQDGTFLLSTYRVNDGAPSGITSSPLIGGRPFRGTVREGQTSCLRNTTHPRSRRCG
jgi:hypothetical protein